MVSQGNNENRFRQPLPITPLPATPIHATPSHRQSTALRIAGRRSTFLVAPEDLSKPPIENPNNSSAYNEQLRQEYETLKSLNSTLETVIESTKGTSLKMKDFGDSVKQASHLLDMWISVQKRAQDTYSVMEEMSRESTKKRSAAHDNRNTANKKKRED
ncbi:hypothetical protein A0J61_05846 [Choanephora cucurbitarum]|uniref:DASH complex subunit DUO1 n=1 Tax=Choanephora cucurbitarum TaxID=101091 RepID=A0A1C7NBG9_9FUNG|nr:hypothetical protein A0J61_05846 [Choanephora cucurbitarum]